MENDAARLNFENLPPSQHKRYILWIATVRRPETRAKRVRRSDLPIGSGIGARPGIIASIVDQVELTPMSLVHPIQQCFSDKGYPEKGKESR
ncbi:YdeI/OmpD-associated family protein [bacterium]|nr:YdeI/OmpD-associated family protein [bacterium]